jgi:hypothetical protein
LNRNFTTAFFPVIFREYVCECIDSNRVVVVAVVVDAVAPFTKVSPALIEIYFQKITWHFSKIYC